MNHLLLFTKKKIIRESSEEISESTKNILHLHTLNRTFLLTYNNNINNNNNTNINKWDIQDSQTSNKMRL